MRSQCFLPFCHSRRPQCCLAVPLLLHMHARARRSLARSLSSRRHAKCGPDLRSVLALEEFQLERSGAVTHKFASNYVVVRVNEREYLHGRERELVGVERERERERGKNKKGKRCQTGRPRRPSLIRPYQQQRKEGDKRSPNYNATQTDSILTSFGPFSSSKRSWNAEVFCTRTGRSIVKGCSKKRCLQSSLRGEF